MKELYTLWYDDDFDIRTAEFKHQAAPRRDIEYLKLEAMKHGKFRNPLVVTTYESNKAESPCRMVIHPGKCRATALYELSRFYHPAVIYVPKGSPAPPQLKRLVKITLEVARGFFDKDQVVEGDHGSFCVKRTD